MPTDDPKWHIASPLPASPHHPATAGHVTQPGNDIPTRPAVDDEQRSHITSTVLLAIARRLAGPDNDIPTELALDDEQRVLEHERDRLEQLAMEYHRKGIHRRGHVGPRGWPDVTVGLASAVHRWITRLVPGALPGEESADMLLSAVLEWRRSAGGDVSSVVTELTRSLISEARQARARQTGNSDAASIAAPDLDAEGWPRIEIDPEAFLVQADLTNRAMTFYPAHTPQPTVDLPGEPAGAPGYLLVDGVRIHVHVRMDGVLEVSIDTGAAQPWLRPSDDPHTAPLVVCVKSMPIGSTRFE